ncbi:MAG TPA: hypothetical protein V6D17_19885 [Candidatus Obscuribacterales bacterium]
MLGIELEIITGRDGKTKLYFRGSRDEILPPPTHDERMEWIRKSFNRFYAYVQDIEDLRSQALRAPATT